jgi:cytochrome c2
MTRLLIASIALATAMAFAVSANAKSSYKKDLGLKCAECHAEGKDKKEPNPDNKLWKKAKDGHGKAKKCGECHEGSTKGKK